MASAPNCPVAYCHTVGQLRAALAAYPDATDLVDDDGQPIAVVGQPGEPASDQHPALDAYLWLASSLEQALYRPVAPADLHRAHLGPPARQGRLPLPPPTGPDPWWEAA